MAPRKKDLSNLALAAGRKTAYDRALDGSQDAVSVLVPVLGPIVASIIRQVAPRDEAIYLRAFAEEVASRIVDLEADKVDRSYFESPGWAEDVGRVTDALRHHRNRGKRSHYVAALTNAASTDRPEEIERHRFLDLLDTIRPSHLRLLAVIVRAQGDPARGGGVDDYLRTALPDHDLEHIKLDWRDFDQAGILQGYPSGLASTPIHLRVSQALNGIGKRFVAFVEAVEDN